ncbi:MAG: SDR family NAD(P)-dependent oxidoreductase, partial [Gammaproteobacteria bacterium]
MDIKSKTAIITGAASGIGLATARELVSQGIAAVGLVDRSNRIHDHAAAINLAAGRAVARSFCGDATD